jgi:hypothetical protein
MNEQELMVQFEVAFSTEFAGTALAYEAFTLDEDGEYQRLAVQVAYQMWKRAKMETRTVKIYGSYEDADYSEVIAVSRVIEQCEKINVKVEFV